MKNNRVLIKHGYFIFPFVVVRFRQRRHGFVVLRRPSVLLLLVDVVMEEFDDEVDVSQNHASAAVTLATQLIEGLPIDSKNNSVRACLQSQNQLKSQHKITYDVETFQWSIRSRYLFHLLPTTLTINSSGELRDELEKFDLLCHR